MRLGRPLRGRVEEDVEHAHARRPPLRCPSFADQDVGGRINLPDDRLERFTLFGGKTHGLEKRLPRAKIQHDLPDLVSLHGPLDFQTFTTLARTVTPQSGR